MAVVTVGQGMGSVRADSIRTAAMIPALTHDEAFVLATTEFERVLTVLEALSGDDWSQPTYCTEWTVREMVAHLAGACAGYASWAEFRRQALQNPYLKETGQQVDGINKRQILDRAACSPEELVAEFRIKGPQAIHTRHRLPWLLRNLTIPFGPPLGTVKVAYLTDTIYTRDQWMHRYDLCAATGRAMTITPEHDGRIVALILRDLAKKLEKALGDHAVDLVITGECEIVCRLGRQGESGCSITLSLFDLALLSSDRVSVTEVYPRLQINGDDALARLALENFSVPY